MICPDRIRVYSITYLLSKLPWGLRVYSRPLEWEFGFGVCVRHCNTYVYCIGIKLFKPLSTPGLKREAWSAYSVIHFKTKQEIIEVLLFIGNCYKSPFSNTSSSAHFGERLLFVSDVRSMVLFTQFYPSTGVAVQHRTSLSVALRRNVFSASCGVVEIFSDCTTLSCLTVLLFVCPIRLFSLTYVGRCYSWFYVGSSQLLP